MLDVFRTADHAGQIFIPHRQSGGRKLSGPVLSPSPPLMVEGYRKLKEETQQRKEWRRPVAETWRWVWVGRKKFSRTKIFEKFPFSRQKFLMTFFSHRPGFSDFLFLFPDFTMLNVVYDPFLTRKTPFFTLFILSRASDNPTSPNIGGRMHGPPPPQIWGASPSPP